MNRFETLMSVLTAPMQRFENACIELITQRSVDVAIGAQLDVLGRIVGQGRGGLADDVYRRYIRARVAANRATGKREELINIAHLIVNSSSLVVRFHTLSNATAILQLDGVAVDKPTADACRDMISRAAAAVGVRIIIEFSLYPPSQTFTLDTGPGLDSGHLAGSEE